MSRVLWAVWPFGRGEFTQHVPSRCEAPAQELEGMAAFSSVYELMIYFSNISWWEFPGASP